MVTACGGGGSGDAPAAPPGDSVQAVPAVLSGVAAVGAPLGGARLAVIDAQGRALGTTVTNATDGSFTLELNTAAPKLPLMLQVAGADASGRPVLLHSALAELPQRAVAHLTPLTDAAVAVALGRDPSPVFANPAEHASAIAGLAKVTAAAEFVRTLVKTNLADTKMAGSATVNLLATPGFTADKTGVDLALETLEVSITSSAAGQPQLQVSNKLGSALAEVTVDLAKAAAELAKATGASPATAITSTLKATTSPATLMTRLASLDSLQAALNGAIASGGGASATAALTAGYSQHNGRSPAELATLIAGWAARNMQMGRLQVTGCADLSIAATGCARVAVAARLIDASGAQTGSFSDAVSWDTRTLAWNLVGNNQPSEAGVQPLAWWSLDANGAPLATAGAPNPQLGVQLVSDGRLASARVQTPGGHVLSLVPCSRPWLCASTTAGATTAVATGDLADHAVLQPGSAWLGAADLATGARWSFTLTPASGSAVTRPVLLRRGFAAMPAAGRFPVLDGIGSSQGLASAPLLAGRSLAWRNWAAANPDMRLVAVRLVLAAPSATEPAVVAEAAPADWQATGLVWPAVTVPESHAGSSVALWLWAQDSAGRWYATRYSGLPVN